MGSPPNRDVVFSAPATHGFQLCPSPTADPQMYISIALSPYPDCLQVAHINSQSLLWHIDEVRRIFTPLSMHPMLFSLSGYKILHNDRIDKGGDGVAIYVSDNIKHKIRSSSPPEYTGKPEFIIIELTIPPNKVILVVVYRPPKAADLSDFEELLSNLIAGYENCITMGYFNIHLLSNTNEVNKLLTTLLCMNNTVCLLGTTYHTAWIDLIFTSKPKLILTHGQTVVLDFKNIDSDKLNSDAALMPRHEINMIDTLDKKISRLSQMITDLYNNTVPLRTRRVTKPPALTGYCTTNAYGKAAKIFYSFDSFGSCRTSGDFWKWLHNLGIGKC
ncbi:hypothetical protein PR048_008549 [Dryococelus australis]|uniref:Endonuclease/exonuclease/phosphatase domain-containing protein n=1 Tax=Dryococelus australis TaxID=614101 RepID=A0ABQ9HXH5_9NEOP|nr:hypothetical protein PR048_008549 [Dryococelus australis]